MDEFKLSLISNNTELNNKDGLKLRLINSFLYIVYIFLVLFLMGTDTSFILVFLISTVGVIFSARFIRQMQSDWVDKRKTIGMVTFSMNMIVLDTSQTKINLSEIDIMKIRGDYYQGYSINHKDITHNGLYCFELILHNKTSVLFKIIVFDKNEFEDLTNYLKFLYGLMKLKIQEKIGVEKNNGFLLRHDRTYAEIKRLKGEIEQKK